MPKQEYSLEAANQRLKEGRVGVSVKQRGETLSLVAMLPPKPGDSRTKPYQQVIALGVLASEDGFKRAESEARRLGSLKALGQFSWSLYDSGAVDKVLAAK